MKWGFVLLTAYTGVHAVGAMRARTERFRRAPKWRAAGKVGAHKRYCVSSSRCLIRSASFASCSAMRCDASSSFEAPE